LRIPAADMATVLETMELLGLNGLVDSYLTDLSGGERQMVFLAQVLTQHPRVLLLDEPTNALDLRNELEILQLVRKLTQENDLTTLIAIHDLNAAVRFADRFILIHDGEVVGAGGVDDVVHPELISSVYGVTVAIGPGPDHLTTVIPTGTFPARLSAQPRPTGPNQKLAANHQTCPS